MRVDVDLEKCVGHAQCFAVAEEIYDIADDDGTCVIRRHTIAPEDEIAAKKGANACPERAISVSP
ncbi:ferredoxin [Rhodococcoides fascians]|uniref:ferredoxin n=1 Tax=Rhodococcoides fascians TaxID=1828 RepID=UPI0009B8C2A7|nr:ferredoxin [Rhodococcus fascians]